VETKENTILSNGAKYAAPRKKRMLGNKKTYKK
jgi:hypothetical protein